MKVKKIEKCTILMFLLAVLFLSIVINIAPQITPEARVSSLGFLQVSNQWITLADGTRITLRGCATSFDNYGNTALISTEIQQLQETGCNCVRLMFTWTDGDPYDTTDMVNAVNTFGAAGIYSIICDGDGYGTGSGDILPNDASTWISNWIGISSTFKSNPYVAIYELMNEPYGATASQMEPYYIECIQAIRANGDNHICMCFDGDFTDPSQLSGLSNVMFDEHDLNTGSAFNDDPLGIGAHVLFPEFAGLNTTNEYVSAEIYASEWVADLIQFRSEFNAPDMMGEIEVYNYSMGTPDAYFNHMLIDLDEHYGISWNVWWLYGWLTNQYGSLGPTYWTTFCQDELGGAFTTSQVSSSIAQNQNITMTTVCGLYSSSFQVFNSFYAYPSNIWSHVNTAESNFWEINYGVTFIDVESQPACSVVFTGPCHLLLQYWSSGDVAYGTVLNDTFDMLNSGQTITLTAGASGITDIAVYTWNNTITSFPLINSRQASPNATPTSSQSPTPTSSSSLTPTPTPTPPTTALSPSPSQSRSQTPSSTPTASPTPSSASSPIYVASVGIFTVSVGTFLIAMFRRQTQKNRAKSA